MRPAVAASDDSADTATSCSYTSASRAVALSRLVSLPLGERDSEAPTTRSHRLRRWRTDEAERREPGAAGQDGSGRGEAYEDDRRIDGSLRWTRRFDLRNGNRAVT
jgi:hypothetical protein